MSETPTQVYTLQAYIEHPDRPYDGGASLPLPTTSEAAQTFLDGVGITDTNRVKIGEVRANSNLDSTIGARLNDAVLEMADTNSLDELNYLAAKIRDMDAEQREIFSAALQAKWHVESIPQIINLTDNLQCFDLQPAFNADMYGEFLIIMAQDDAYGCLERLEISQNGDDRDFAQYVKRLEACVDTEAYGKAVAKEEGGVFTDYGYLRQVEDVATKYQGIEDIPAEARFSPGASAVAAEPTPPYQIVDSTDLTTLVMQMHVLDGDLQKEAPQNIAVLEARRSTHYLMIMMGHSAFLTEAMHVYRHGSKANVEFLHPFHPEEANVFALTAKDVHQAHVLGNLVQIDYEALREDIAKNSIYFSHVDAKFKDGPEVTFTAEQWEAGGKRTQSDLQDVTRRFAPRDLQTVRQHLDDVDAERHARGMPIDAETFLSGFNEAFMGAVRNSQKGMIRIPIPVAEALLHLKDANVYSMVPEGITKLSPLDTLPNGRLRQPHYQNIAIQKADLVELEKWADREVAKITHHQQAERASNTEEVPAKARPSLMETLKRNREKSREMFGNPQHPTTPNKNKGEPEL